MSDTTEPIPKPREADALQTNERILREAGADHRAYADALHNRHASTLLGESLSGTAYLVGTCGETDPFDMYFERIRSFEDGAMIGLRVAQDVLGPDYVAILTETLSVHGAEEWKNFFAECGPEGLSRAAIEVGHEADAGMQRAGEYGPVLIAFSESLACLDPKDNLLVAGFGYMMTALAVTKGNLPNRDGMYRGATSSAVED